jgi:hypothetical protein
VSTRRDLDSILEDAIPCVFHTHAVYQFAPEDRHRLYALLVERSALRDVVVRIGMEPSEAGRSVLSIYRHGYGSNVWQTAITTMHGSPGTPIRCVTRRDALRWARVAREIFGAGKIEVPRKWARKTLRHRLN